LWPSTEVAKDAFERLYYLSDIALISFEDEVEVFKENDMQCPYKRFQQKYPQLLVIKNGGEDCYVSIESQKELERVALDKVEHVIDATSAGDSFNAGFIYGLLNCSQPKSAVAYGHCLAKAVIQHKGAIIPASSMPYTELKRL